MIVMLLQSISPSHDEITTYNFLLQDYSLEWAETFFHRASVSADVVCTTNANFAR
jgi:hypothetical protein